MSTPSTTITRLDLLAKHENLLREHAAALRRQVYPYVTNEVLVADAIDEALTLLRETPQPTIGANPWQPMETLTGDHWYGRSIIVWVPFDNDGDVKRCQFMVSKGPDDKLYHWGEGATRVLAYQPTHWKPLDPPPTDSSLRETTPQETTQETPQVEKICGKCRYQEPDIHGGGHDGCKNSSDEERYRFGYSKPCSVFDDRHFPEFKPSAEEMDRLLAAATKLVPQGAQTQEQE